MNIIKLLVIRFLVSCVLVQCCFNVQGAFLFVPNGRSLYKVNTDTGAATLIGAENSAFNTFGGTLDRQGRFLLALDSGFDFGHLDPDTGAEILIANSNFLGNRVYALEVDLQTGVIYGVDWDANGTLVTINGVTGVATSVGPTGIPRVTDLAFDPAGNLWAANEAGQLYTIDKATGASTLVTQVPGLVNDLSVIAFDNNGVLYGMLYVANNADLFTIDTATGNRTVIGNTGIRFPYGGDIGILGQPQVLGQPRVNLHSSPTISAIPDQTVFGESVVGPIPFTISDAQTNSNQLRVSAKSGNRNLIEDQDILISGAGSNRSLLITDIGRTGTFSEITISVTDSTGAVGTTSFTVTSFSGPSVVVDNMDSGFSSAGQWSESGAIDEFRGSSLVAMFGGSSAIFDPGALVPGDYRVFAWWSSALPGGRTAFRSRRVDYTVNHEGNSSHVRVDQNARSGEWFEMGTFSFSGSENENVTVSALVVQGLTRSVLTPLRL